MHNQRYPVDDNRQDSSKRYHDRCGWDNGQEWEEDMIFCRECGRKIKKDVKNSCCFFDERKCKLICPFTIEVKLVPCEERIPPRPW